MHTRRIRQQRGGPGQATTDRPGADLLGRTRQDVPGAEGNTLEAFLRVLRRRWVAIAACALTACGAAVALSMSQENEYASSASLLFRDAGLEEAVLGSSSGSGDPQREAATNLDLGAVAPIAARTAERLRLPGVDRDDVSSTVDVSSNGDSDVVSVSATTADPELSARMANVYAEEYIAFRHASDRARVTEATREVRRQLARLTPLELEGPRGRSLREQAETLDTLAALRTGGVELVERARPNGDPVSPRPKRAAGVGLLLGLLLGLALTFLLEQLDRRLREPDDVEEAFGYPIVGRIPASRALRRADSRSQLELPPAEAEAFRMLRAHLRYFSGAEPIRSVVVTSAVSGEGKSTVAWNLALADAQAGRSVLLIEANLRRPRLAERLKLPGDSGLATILAGAADGEEAVITLQVGGTMLDVIAAGPPPPNPAELLESRSMGVLLDRYQERYDLVVVDTAPALAVSDVTPLLGQVDGVLVVASVGQTTTGAAADLRKQLRAGRARVLGVVLNRDTARRSTYGAYGTTGSAATTASPGRGG